MQFDGPPTQDSIKYFALLCNNGNNKSVFIQTSSELDSLSYLGKKREWICIFDSASGVSLSFAIEADMREWLVVGLQQRADFSKWERELFCIVDSQQMGVSWRICTDPKVSATYLIVPT